MPAHRSRNPGDNPVAIPLDDVRARCIRVTATRLWERTQDFVFALAEALRQSAAVLLRGLDSRPAHA